MRYILLTTAVAISLTGCTTVRTVYRRLRRMFNDFTGEETALLGARAWHWSPLIGVAMVAVLIAACDSTSMAPPQAPPHEVSAMKGSWSYSASFRVGGSPPHDKVTCEIQDMTITVGDPTNEEWPYYLQAEASGGTLECTGDTIDDFAQDLPSAIAVTVWRAILALGFDFTLYPPKLRVLDVANKSSPSSCSSCARVHNISADRWTGSILVGPPVVGLAYGTGEFTAVRR